MYVGEVNVMQEKLAGLIKAAECLKIKGLAVPDEDPMESKDNSSIDRERHKRSQRGEDSPRAKRRRRENSSDVSEEILSPVRSRPSARNREYHSSQNSKSAPVASSVENEETFREVQGRDASEESENSSINANRQVNFSSNKPNLSHVLNESTQKKEKVADECVKVEPTESEAADTVQIEEEQDNKTSLHQALGLDLVEDSELCKNAALLEPLQIMEEVVAEVIPGASEYQANSFLWEGEGSLSAFPGDGFSGDSSSQSRQMVLYQGSPTNSWPSPPSASLMATTAAAHLGKFTSHHSGAHLPGVATAQSRLKRYHCPYCDYSSYVKISYDRHIRVHTGEKPFACNICSYKSSQKSHLNRHMFTHAPAPSTS